MTEKVIRNIYFFRLKANFGTNRFRFIKRYEFLECINSLKFYNNSKEAISKENSRFVPLPSSDNLAMGVWNYNDKKHEYIISKLRRDQLPQQVSGKNIKDLKMDADSWLADSIHVKFFQDGLFGVEMNGYSVSPTRLSYFLQYRFSELLGDVRVFVLSNKTYQDLLSNLSNVRYFEIKVHRNILDEINANKKLKDRTIADYLRKSFEFYESESLTVKYGVSRSVASMLNMTKFNEVSCLLDTVSLRPFIEKFKVKGKYFGNKKSEEKDFLESNLSFSREIVKLDPRNRKIDSESMFEAINNTYKQHKQIISKAHGIESEE